MFTKILRLYPTYPPKPYSRRFYHFIHGVSYPGRGPCLYLHAVGPGNFWSACRMLTETEDEEEGSGMSVLPTAAALGCEYLTSSGKRFQRFSPGERRVGFWGSLEQP